jgi:cytochrome c-type biogenesis protein CcmE
MSHKAAKIGVTTLVLATVFGVLLYTTLGESMQYYKYVDEVVGSQSDWSGKKLQVHGYVVPGSIGKKRDALEYRFDIQRNGKTLRAFYNGITPDTFKDDSEVVLTGVLTKDGFIATDMTAKCPSKYEAASWPRRQQPLAVMASLGYYLLLAAFVVGRIRHGDLCGRCAPSLEPDDRERRRGLLPPRGHHDRGIVGDHLRLRHRRLLHSIRSALFGQRPAALLQAHVVLGRPGRVDHVLGLPAVAFRQRRRSISIGSGHRELIPYVVAIIATVEMFFLLLMVVHNNPFDTYLTESPADGAGLNPLLQNFYMVIHPPTMYLGFVGLTIPYAFGMAALITGYLDDSWLRAVRRWTMVSWLFLSIGLGLGMIWAYEELGWGGYWMWDPVENAGLLPWFTATAFLHSVMVQERRGCCASGTCRS